MRGVIMMASQNWNSLVSAGTASPYVSSVKRTAQTICLRRCVSLAFSWSVRRCDIVMCRPYRWLMSFIIVRNTLPCADVSAIWFDNI